MLLEINISKAKRIGEKREKERMYLQEITSRDHDLSHKIGASSGSFQYETGGHCYFLWPRSHLVHFLVLLWVIN
jgi:hypothetical protein